MLDIGNWPFLPCLKIYQLIILSYLKHEILQLRSSECRNLSHIMGHVANTYFKIQVLGSKNLLFDRIPNPYQMQPTTTRN